MVTRADDFWALEPGWHFLNHGSFGACPRPVAEAADRFRTQLERQPLRFMMRELPELLDGARRATAAFVGSAPEDLVFVSNATAGVNAVLRSLSFAPGDELLTIDHAYNACANALRYVAERAGAHAVIAKVPFPLQSADQVVEAVLAAVTPRTRIALLDHITSATGLVLTIERLVSELESRGVPVLVDGAHAPGMLPLDVTALGASFYTGNLHKWVCAPKGAAFLHVRPDWQDRVRPTCISHGANMPTDARSRYLNEFDWTGTQDFSPWLALPAAIELVGSRHPGGWRGLMEANRARALAARPLVCDALQCEVPAPDGMIGALVSLPMPSMPQLAAPASVFDRDPVQEALYAQRIEIPVSHWPAPGQRVIRYSSQDYNTADDYEALATALAAIVSDR